MKRMYSFYTDNSQRNQGLMDLFSILHISGQTLHESLIVPLHITPVSLAALLLFIVYGAAPGFVCTVGDITTVCLLFVQIHKLNVPMSRHQFHLTADLYCRFMKHFKLKSFRLYCTLFCLTPKHLVVHFISFN